MVTWESGFTDNRFELYHDTSFLFGQVGGFYLLLVTTVCLAENLSFLLWVDIFVFYFIPKYSDTSANG